MDPNPTFRIQTDAAKALAEWKAFFAEQVAQRARELAKDSSSPGLITVAHYRQAAQSAVQTLATLLEDTDSRDVHQEAA